MNKVFWSFSILWFVGLRSVNAQNPNPSISLDQFILSEMATEHIPAMSTLVVKDGEIVWRNSYGLADVENNVAATDSTAFLMASVSKLFVATAIMQLEEEGLLDLYTSIDEHLPFPVRNPGHPSTPITFRMLMTHTSSIRDNDQVMDTYYSIGDPTISLSDVIQRYFSPSGTDYDAQNNFHTQAPGSFYDYSNIATALSGYLVERVAQVPFNEYCNTHIFDLLCMNNSS